MSHDAFCELKKGTLYFQLTSVGKAANHSGRLWPPTAALSVASSAFRCENVVAYFESRTYRLHAASVVFVFVSGKFLRPPVSENVFPPPLPPAVCHSLSSAASSVNIPLSKQSAFGERLRKTLWSLPRALITAKLVFTPGGVELTVMPEYE